MKHPQSLHKIYKKFWTFFQQVLKISSENSCPLLSYRLKKKIPYQQINNVYKYTWFKETHVTNIWKFPVKFTQSLSKFLKFYSNSKFYKKI